MAGYTCETCKSRIEYQPTRKSPCKVCGYDPMRRSKRIQTDGERDLVDYFSRNMGFRLARAVR